MAEKPNYFESLKSTVIRADGLDSVPIQELELTLSVLLKWFPEPKHIPSAWVGPEHMTILDGAFWRFEACKQLAGYIAERKAPKTETE